MKKTQSEQMNASTQFCPNRACCARGQVGQGNSVIHGRTRPRYRCKTCGKTFSAREGTIFAGLRKPTELIVIVVTRFSYGCPRQVTGSPIIGGQTIYSLDPGGGVLYALNAATGEVRATLSVGATARFATPMLSKGSIFIGTLTGIVAVGMI